MPMKDAKLWSPDSPLLYDLVVVLKSQDGKVVDTIRSYFGMRSFGKQLDPSRLVDEASGFPWHGGGDIQDNHGGVSAPNPRQIGLVSENGGFGVATPGHDWPCEIWTYRSYDAATDSTFDAMGKGVKGDKLPKLDEKSKAWFTREVARLYAGLWAQKDDRGMTGQFFCQLYDTESECDGLVSYDRAVWKVDSALLSKAARGELNSAELKPAR